MSCWAMIFIKWHSVRRQKFHLIIIFEARWFGWKLIAFWPDSVKYFAPFTINIFSIWMHQIALFFTLNTSAMLSNFITDQILKSIILKNEDVKMNHRLRTPQHLNFAFNRLLCCFRWDLKLKFKTEYCLPLFWVFGVRMAAGQIHSMITDQKPVNNIFH